MRLPDEAIDEFRALYRDEFGEEISRDDAAQIAVRLVTLINLLRHPPPRGEESDHFPRL